MINKKIVEKDKKQVKEYKNQGITLIALVITIIILLILAGVSIATLTGDNGILNQANKSKENTEIGEEKEKVKLVTNADLITNNGEKNTKEGLQKELESSEGVGKTKVIKDGKDSYVVTFLDTNRNYKINSDKNVEGPVEIEKIEDEYAGDITKGGTLDGSESKPYKINCIEDLVEFSNMSKKDTFGNKKIVLDRDLDFESELSYANYEDTKYGDINEDGITTDLLTELSTELGFHPISAFRGHFDGQRHEIKNLYMTNSNEKGVKQLGMFRSLYNGATIENLSVNVDIKSECDAGTSNCVGGVVGIITNASNVELRNNSCSGKIISNARTGGIVGGIFQSENTSIGVNLFNCNNTSNIESSFSAGGIVGNIANSNGYKILYCRIINCNNEGDIVIRNNSEGSVGGIVGGCVYGEIYNCYNIGNIINDSGKTYSSAGGIVGNTASSGIVNINNCYNIGKTRAKFSYITNFSGGILGGFWYGQYKTNIKHCYYDQTASDRSVGGSKEEHAKKLTQEQIKNKELIQDDDGTNKNLVDILNNYIENNPDGLDTSTWSKWKKGENGYPVFEK